MRALAIIPARSGSKGLPDKNIKQFAGHPLMYYSIHAAIRSGMFDNVMVSTDSEHYAAIAGECGAEVPFLRSTDASTDTASSWDVVREVLREYKSRGKEFDVVCLLQPTSPLRSEVDICDGFKLMEDTGSDTVVSVCEADHSPLWMNTLPESLSMDGFIRKEVTNTGRQNLETYYRINGALYITKVSLLFAEDTIYKNSRALIMPRDRSIDIDTELDFVTAEAIYKNRLSTESIGQKE